MEQIAGSPTCAVTAFVTGEPAKGKEWAERYGVPNATVYTYESMGLMKTNPAVQAVYVATPNGLHRRDVLASAAAGKHVPVREADGHYGGGLQGNDCRLPGCKREADDCVPHAV